MKIKVSSFNIQHGINHAQRLAGEKARVDLDRVADHIAEMGVEIVGIQEIYNCPPDGVFPDQPGYIAKKLGWHSAFAKAIDVVGKDGAKRPYGVAILSKYPIISMNTFHIAVPEEERIYVGKSYEERVLMVCQIDIDGKVITFMNSHFGLTPDAKALATETVLAEKAKIQGPVIFTGDLNLRPTMEWYPKLAEVFTDSITMNTDPELDPDVRIDYIFVDGGIKPLYYEKRKEIISDHRAIMAELEIED